MFSLACISYFPKSNAQRYYRVETPLRGLEKLFNYNVYTPPVGEIPETKDMHGMLNSSDILLCHSLGDPGNVLKTLKGTRATGPITINNETKYPPLFVWDCDDNLDFVSPLNDAFSTMGTRNIDGTLLSPGDKLTVIQNGEEHTLWEDRAVQLPNGDYRFDITRNLKQAKLRQLFIKECHGAIACSQDLASYYRDALGQKNVHVFYNTVNPEDYKFNIIPQRENTKEVRIFWQGGQSHLHDFLPLRNAIKTVAEKYPHTKWIFWGMDFPFIKECIPASQYEYHSWMPYDVYKLRRTLFNVDINICPLSDNIFNRCKSAIKWYESTVSHNLEATLAQAAGPYKEIEDGKTGLLFSTEEEFVQKISLLIEDAELRNRLGEGARDWVNNNRLPKHTIPSLNEFFIELKEKQLAELSPKIIPATPSNMKEALRGKL